MVTIEEHALIRLVN